MKTPEEIVKALRESCACNEFVPPMVTNTELTDAADMIESLQGELAASQRREKAAVEDLKIMALAMRESDEMQEGCCFACINDAQNLPGNVILAYGECPGYDRNDCFQWRGPEEEDHG